MCPARTNGTSQVPDQQPNRPVKVEGSDTQETTLSPAAVEYYRLCRIVATNPPEVPMLIALMEAHIAFAAETGHELEVIGQWLRMIDATSE